MPHLTKYKTNNFFPKTKKMGQKRVGTSCVPRPRLRDNGTTGQRDNGTTGQRDNGTTGLRDSFSRRLVVSRRDRWVLLAKTPLRLCPTKKRPPKESLEKKYQCSTAILYSGLVAPLIAPVYSPVIWRPDLSVTSNVSLYAPFS